ncbi:MAG: hypothetical protein Q7S74_00760 [Nanoarchaeota archaeon]|nr:hypothetical protein [Nanoarchaeota archaeon]
MSKIVGYIIALVGLVGVAASSVPLISDFIPILKLPFSSTIILGVSLVLVVIGLLFASKGSRGKQPAEVPIYQGKNVVGYRRMRK